MGSATAARRTPHAQPAVWSATAATVVRSAVPFASRSTAAISPASITSSASPTRISSPAARKRCTSSAGSDWQSTTRRRARPAWSSTISSSDPSWPGVPVGYPSSTTVQGPRSRSASPSSTRARVRAGATAEPRGTCGIRCSPASCRARRRSLHTRSGSAPPRARFSQTSPGGEVGPAAHEATPRVFPAPVGPDTRVTIPPTPASRSSLRPCRGNVQDGTRGTPARTRDSASTSDATIARLMTPSVPRRLAPPQATTSEGEVSSPPRHLTPGDPGTGLDQLVAPGEGHGFLTRVGTELPIEGLHVALHRVG